MTGYHVQKGDTIADVSKRLNTNWKTLRSNNPDSIGKAKNGNWFLKEGAEITTETSFEKSLLEAQQKNNHTSPPKPPTHILQGQAKHIYKSEPTQEFSPKTTESVQGKQIIHTIQAGDTIWELAVKKYHVHIADIMKDNNITDPTHLQIGQELKIRLPESGSEKPVVASWYGEAFNGKPMANGDIYDMYAATIAHKEMPLGTEVELQNTLTGEMARAIVTDRGPYIEGRDVDLSYGLAQKLSLVEQGVGELIMRVL
jgi:rare lipoprotein A